MKKVCTFLICLLMLGSLVTVTAFAASDRLVDDADLLSASEETAVRAKLDEVSEKHQMDVVVVTTESIGMQSPRSYADSFYDDNGYGIGESRDGVLLLISMEDRDWHILANGAVSDTITSDVIDSIGEVIVEDLSLGEYADAFETFAEECGDCMSFDIGFNLLVAVIIGLVIALIVTGIMCAQLKSVYRQPAASEYVKAGSLNVTLANEFFLYRNITRTKRASESSGSRSGGSSSGRSHGGGKF